MLQAGANNFGMKKKIRNNRIRKLKHVKNNWLLSQGWKPDR
jgi:hypothetical protein